MNFHVYRFRTLRLGAAALFSLAAAVTAAPAAHATQGVSAETILLGTIQDLSGPAASIGKHALAGMQMRIDEINAAGGIHGRRLVLRAEDSAYVPRQSVLAAEKLIKQERIFALVGHFGTANNLAVLPLQAEREVVNFMPLAPAREMYEPPHALKLAMLVSGHEQMLQAVPRLVADKRAERTCILYQDDEFGLEVLRGTEAGLARVNKTLAERASYKRGATDFSSQMSRLKAAGCDLVVLGTVVRETIGAVATSRALGFAPTFVATVAAYTDFIHRLGGPAMNGLYVTMAAAFPYADADSPDVRAWTARFKERNGEHPNGAAALGWMMIDQFAQAARLAGPSLTTAGFLAAMDGLRYDDALFGSPPQHWTAARRLGSDASRLSRIVDGRWQVVSGYLGAD